MMARRRALLGLAIITPLAGSAVLLVARSDQPAVDPAADVSSASAAVVSAPRGEVRERAARAIRLGGLQQRRREARREDPQGEPGPRPATVALYERAQAKAEPVARRFFAAFSRYELGERSAGVARALRASATAAFARELLAAPPRRVAGAPAAPASLGRVEFIPGRSGGGRLVGGEIVGVTRRDGRAEPISIELEAERGSWRVSGLGR